MSNDFNISPEELRVIEHEARRLRAEALRYGIRSLKGWTGSIMHRRNEPTTL